MPRTRTGSYPTGRRRRERIVEAAVAQFAERGYHRTSLAQIAAAAEITEGGLLHHFPSKRHLLLAVAEHRIEATATWWDELGPAPSLADVLAHRARTMARFLDQPGLIQLNVLAAAEAADPSSPAHAALADRYRAAVDGLAAILERCTDRASLPAGTDCTALAREFVAVSDGLQLQWVLSDGAIDLVAGIQEHSRRFLPPAPT
ncbi:TetR/AcrR family transcriptional regulator [Actinoplanes sp. L3-i22]|uniref:TetR/AcrR family transcriptional regulator n=1 Tax=Actinoplanes sp. L3-i22 TaxID=2836373 RepID=UPI001C791D90|nr:TetR/AcrR family transcriptional regulator [Actinoplanes sp. L3-i22]BCY10770.1 TetR family transcriptional regulator [Actinoplanes sp. L3-i22]